MQGTLKILIADDDESDRKQIKRALAQAPGMYQFTEAESIKQALVACEKISFDCAVVDYRLPGEDGLDGVTSLHDRLPYMAIIMSTGHGDETVAAEAMKRGALDYLPKTHTNAESIKRAVAGAIEKVALQKQIDRQRSELTSFSHVLVHDLKTPILSLHAGANLIQRNVLDGDLEIVPQLCSEIIKRVERVLEMLDALHRHATVDEPIEMAQVDMNQVVDDVALSLALQIQERGAVVTHDNLPLVTGNGPQLMQLLQNLIGNGIKFSRSTVPSVHVSALRRDSDCWLFQVQDNGIGIPGKDLDFIFEPFKRLESAVDYEGTGLGLATCKKIAEQNSGKIWCESTLGKGSSFFFTLPAERTPKGTRDDQSPAAYRAST